MHQLPSNLVHHCHPGRLVVHLWFEALESAKAILDRAVTAWSLKRTGQCGWGTLTAAAHLCWMTSRSSSFSGICMLLSHCSFSSIQSSQASASLNILYRARVSCSARFRSRASAAHLLVALSHARQPAPSLLGLQRTPGAGHWLARAASRWWAGSWRSPPPRPVLLGPGTGWSTTWPTSLLRRS